MKTLIQLIICLFICTSQINAQPYYYKQLSLQDGLPSTVRCIFTEKKGFVWIGTQAGLGRYDGHELKKYAAHPNIPNSLPSNHIVSIMEDKEHTVWILTEGGIARYERKSDNFHILRDEKGKPIIALCSCLTDQGIIFGGTNKIYLYSYAEQSVKLLQEFKTEANFAIFTIAPWKPGVLMCSNRWLGIILVDIHTGKTSLPPFDCGKEIRSVFVDSQKRVWIAPYNNGVRCYDPNGRFLASYTTQNSKLSHNVVLCLEEQHSRIWVGTDGGGINILNPETKEISILEHTPGDNHSLPVNSILYLHNDSYNNMWAGSIRSGLISIRETSIKTYTDAAPGSDRGMSDNTVLSLYEEPASHKIWIGTDGGGINCFDPVGGKFKHYPTTWKDKVTAITGFTNQELLLSLFSKGVFIFNKTTGSSRPLIIVNEEVNARVCFRGKAVNLYQYSPESVLLLADHLYRYTLASKQFELVKEEEGMEITGALLPIATRLGSFYFNDLKRIYVLDHRINKITTLFECSGDTYINAVSLDPQGIFWIGSNYGLARYTPADKQYKPIYTTLFGEVNSLICDRSGKVWIGSDGTLFTWLTKEKKFTMFGESDGVALNEYQQKPRIESTTGDIYMGGVKGLLRISKDLSIDTSEVPSLQLTDVSVDGEAVNSLLTGVPPEIYVPWDNKTITVRVISQEKDILRKKIYRYQIIGLSNQNIDSYQPELIIRSLPPGKYSLMASCSTRDGDWTDALQVLTITVTPPWYKSWWFILGCILILSYALIQAFLFTLKRKDDKLKWTLKEHEQQVYEEKVRFLINISHELRTPLTLIYGPLHRLLQSTPATDVNQPVLKGIYKQARRMKDLINMVLDLRKMEVGASKIDLQLHPLNEWMQNVCHDFTNEGEARDIRINCQPDERIGEVSFDAVKCETILTNFLINALKHSPEHSEIRITSELIPEQEKVRISIIDQGCGLKQVDINKLFTRFYQGANEQGGTGIGLSYAKILSELQGGAIGAKDNSTIGATFFFELPLRTKSEEIVCQPKAYLNELIADNGKKEADLENSLDTNKYSVLVVDDNEDMIAFFKESLKGQFRQIFTATDGVEAMINVRKYQPDIVISDVMMPRKNGYELCSEIKDDIEISHIPVILLTARGDRDSELYGYKNGADAYLPKPFDIDFLLELIRNKLRIREQSRIRYQHTGIFPQPEESTFSQVDETFLLKLNKLIITNLENPELDVTFLYKEMAMSRASLYNKLKTLTNMGANDYINKFRMEKALLLISTTSLSFTEIAEKTGYSTGRYFSTAFKLYTGETPTQYKEKMNNKTLY